MSQLVLSPVCLPGPVLTCLSVCVPVYLSISRLVYRQFYPLAMEICRYLKIPDYQGVSRVLKHWASCKVRSLAPPTGAGPTHLRLSE